MLGVPEVKWANVGDAWSEIGQCWDVRSEVG
jgi:hypothetical protein